LTEIATRVGQHHPSKIPEALVLEDIQSDPERSS
jgi:hypothetical protein